MYVVLDSSVIIEHDWLLTSTPAIVLLESSRRREFKVVVPEIVVREVTTKHRERETLTIQKLENARTALKRLQGSLSAHDHQPTEAISERWAETFRSRLSAAFVEVSALDSATIDELVGRALDRRRPFDDNGQAGFRDALIWHVVLALAQSEDVVLISRDGDFAARESRELHPDLLGDLEAQGLTADRVRLFTSLEEAVRELLAPADALAEELSERLDEDALFHDLLKDELADAAIGIESMGTMVYVEEIAVELDSDYEQWSHWIRYQEVTGFSDYGNLRISRAYPADAGLFGVEVTLDAEAEVNVWISKEAWWSRPPRSTIDFDTDEDSWEFPVPAVGKVTLEYWSRYSVDEGGFVDHQLTEVRNRRG